MRCRLWALILVAVIIISTAAFLSFYPASGPKASGLGVPVGAFLYLWYGNATGGVGGLGSPGWNSSTYPGGGAVVDTPAIGYYVSDSNATFQWQVKEMQSAGISFALISWWGPSRTGEAGAINKATLDFFRYLKGTNSAFKAAIMVDAFEGGNNLNESTLNSVYDYVFSQFASTYSNWYFSWEGHPLLLFFNPIYPQTNDTRFTVRTIGNRPNPVDWQFWNAPVSFFQSQLQPGVDAANDIGNPFISSDGEVTIVPRIDSYYNNRSGYQEGYLRFDPTLQLGLYQAEWNFVLNHRSEVKLVLIYSWNEYHERSTIEPHVDGTSSVPSTYLLNLTASFTSQLEKGAGAPGL
ncbi:MAG: hypothetical protein JRN34_03550 [Nitrososphaerota archaeon]|nr:hypothetical protein [Nitrososphaerota archaeon]